MMSHPSQEDLENVLAAAGTAHHEFEQNYLGGSRDEQWAAWYAAYVLGRLGDLVSPSVLTHQRYTALWRRPYRSVVV